MEKKPFANSMKAPPPLHLPRATPPSWARPPPTQRIKTLRPREVERKIEKKIEEKTKQFQTSDRFQFLAPFFEQGQKTNITQCICLGLGHFMAPDPQPHSSRKGASNFNWPLHQLAMLELLLRGLTKGKSAAIPVYFQDTIFTSSEKECLESFNYIVAKDYDSGLASMSPSTFLFAPDIKGVTVSLALIDCFPALYVGIDLDGAAEYIGTRDVKERERYMRPLEQYKAASTDTPGLPIFLGGAQNGFESWDDACVRWLDPEYVKTKEADRMGKEVGRSKAMDEGKGKEIDYWDWDPPR